MNTKLLALILITALVAFGAGMLVDHQFIANAPQAKNGSPATTGAPKKILPAKKSAKPFEKQDPTPDKPTTVSDLEAMLRGSWKMTGTRS